VSSNSWPKAIVLQIGNGVLRPTAEKFDFNPVKAKRIFVVGSYFYFAPKTEKHWKNIFPSHNLLDLQKESANYFSL